ncbi:MULTISPECIES: hypothetical protein [unclassified Bacillus (in: firmicutes)]|uniref:hypothetical protein n=1 Tax=unclassified Bacillus (in: firmicutes) TaxID=185979 RepID=UPI00163D17F9|nr:MULTISPECIES: hypothetical protein [unclassified Bacillus (in: firmicutes)]QNH48715.1 hypothetical protein H7F25_04370 [Bacillus sp. PAMC28571]QNK43010.1 hypothetical protein H7F24_10935 [Bacillus sp. PAMC22265]
MDKAMAYIDKLAAKLGVAAEHVYGVLVKQAVANGVANILAGIGLIAIAITYVLIVLHLRDRFDVSAWAVVGIVAVLTVVTPVFAGFPILSEGIKAVINPEYYAIKEILDTIGGK